MNKVAKQVKKKMNPDSIKKFHNAVKPLSVDYKIGKYEVNDNYLFADKKLLEDLFADPKNRKKNKILLMGNYGSDWVVIKVNEFIPGSLKELNETRGPVTAKYEEFLEDAWTKTLQSKYQVVVNQEVVDTLKKKLVNSQ
jgi:peptidyl-prolyl cis-trans isomerase SurA